MVCCSKPNTSLSSSSDGSPTTGKLSSSCQPAKHHQQEETEPILSLRSPLDPDTEYRVVWAKKSLWKRRLEGLQQRYPSDKELDCSYSSSEDENDVSGNDDDATWIMDNSQKSHAPSQEDRWGESSSSSLPTVIRLDDSDDDDDNDDATTVSCPSHIGMSRWGDDQEASASPTLVSCQSSSSRSISSESSTAPRVPCRRLSLQDDSETPRIPSRRASLLQDDSEMSCHSNDVGAPSYDVSWLDGLYSTVREFREDWQKL